MPLHLRRRGKIYHARGTVRIGKESIVVDEFSTGTGSRADAKIIADQEADRIKQERTEGAIRRSQRITIAEWQNVGGVDRLCTAVSGCTR